ncbi:MULTISPECIES: MerR family transcriptional regulator [Shewanella]|jgi:DNA-binding transcriptional MerR regulator|uniref:MerR family transcriptional regulator n=1 Tax=Shewanella TaxID=22 RepID=UPI000C7D3257|nr:MULTISPECIES: MerR family transcriptional regulator [Shewanella]MBB1425284.1 MerR family transcriptional regulator [Shewanella sp. SG44-2]PKH97967.1 MerR family transcriptional regulator [Shewanella sp. 11B5]RPA36018.1 MerR family transcriptional regulator [Shewanella frigidimarina]|tara:strand:- start:597 stop:953 length:357 start_codon:yes stop_codon:yes gene_type:complete
MNMKAFSTLAGLSSYTLRYYEKVGLLNNIQRNSSGHRVYTAKDLEWINFVKRLKDTGMALTKIQQYAQLRSLGPGTVLDRQQLLECHKDQLQAHIELQKNHLLALENKISLYKANKVS